MNAFHPDLTLDDHSPFQAGPSASLLVTSWPTGTSTPGSEIASSHSVHPSVILTGVEEEDNGTAAGDMYITGSTKWDIFVIYIIFCCFFITFCCLSVIFLFWCCPAREPGGARLGANTSIYLGGSPTATTTRLTMRRSSSMKRIMELPQHIP